MAQLFTVFVAKLQFTLYLTQVWLLHITFYHSCSRNLQWAQEIAKLQQFCTNTSVECLSSGHRQTNSSKMKRLLEISLISKELKKVNTDPNEQIQRRWFSGHDFRLLCYSILLAFNVKALLFIFFHHFLTKSQQISSIHSKIENSSNFGWMNVMAKSIMYYVRCLCWQMIKSALVVNLPLIKLIHLSFRKKKRNNGGVVTRVNRLQYRCHVKSSTSLNKYTQFKSKQYLIVTG